MVVMDSLFGVVGDGFVVVAAGTSAVRTSYVFSNPDHDRLTQLGSHLLLAATGLSSDRLRLRDELKATCARGGNNGDAAAAAAVARLAVLAHAQSASAVVAGYDVVNGPSMYAVGAAAPPERVSHGAAGSGAGLCGPVLERLYRPGMTVKEAVEILDRCIKEVRRIGLASFVIMVVDKAGAREYAKRLVVVKPKPELVAGQKFGGDTPMQN